MPLRFAALTAAGLLAWREPARAARRWAMPGTLCLALSLGLWAALVQPANVAWGRVWPRGGRRSPGRLRARGMGLRGGFHRLAGRFLPAVIGRVEGSVWG